MGHLNFGQFLFQSGLLVAALTVDAFFASLAYGADRIKIPPVSALVIDGVCTGILAVSLFAGSLIGPLIPPAWVTGISFGMLFLLGTVKLFDSALKALIQRRQKKRARVCFRLSDLRFILQIYVDSTRADADRSRSLSVPEAVSLAVALSVDGLAAGFGAGLLDQVPWLTLLLSLLITAAAIFGGSILGKKLSEKVRFDFGWCSGILLILLAICKL